MFSNFTSIEFFQKSESMFFSITKFKFNQVNGVSCIISGPRVPSILRGLVATCLSPSKQQPLILSITSFPLFETRLMIFSFIYCIFKSRYLDVDLFFTLCLCGNLGVCFVAEQQNNDIDKG